MGALCDPRREGGALSALAESFVAAVLSGRPWGCHAPKHVFWRSIARLAHEPVCEVPARRVMLDRCAMSAGRLV